VSGTLYAALDRLETSSWRINAAVLRENVHARLHDITSATEQRDQVRLFWSRRPKNNVGSKPEQLRHNMIRFQNLKHNI